ncbi:probable carboxylesterase 12 [Argentina anserina]|uniref:probable carboxylesterase 12 n=1 Tax=Argentina anserina TaxID=57926 RepID=UPI0021766C85|nr:probable carboxylesterase 12 [Potentilla anserina]
MDPATSNDEIAFEFLPLFRLYKDGRVDRLKGTETLPPSTDPTTGVQSKDIVLSPESGLSARIFLPKLHNPTQKLPFLLYIHGGAFVLESPSSPIYHSYLNTLTAEANVVALSIRYRRAPEHPLPAAFEDSWAAFQWAAAHSTGGGPEAWLNEHADFNRVFVAGDSAGATLAHHVVRQSAVEGVSGVNIMGAVLFHPYFRDEGPDKLLEVIYPTGGGLEDPKVYPRKDPKLGSLGVRRVLVVVAEKDFIKDRGWGYYEALKKSGWGGIVEIEETEGEDHVFHLFNPSCEKAVSLLKKVAAFMNQE